MQRLQMCLPGQLAEEKKVGRRGHRGGWDWGSKIRLPGQSMWGKWEGREELRGSGLPREEGRLWCMSC